MGKAAPETGPKGNACKTPRNHIPRGSGSHNARFKKIKRPKCAYLFLSIFSLGKGSPKNLPRIPPVKVQVAPGFFEPRRHWAATLSRSQCPRWSGSLLRCPWRLPPSSARLSAARHSEDLGVLLLRYSGGSPFAPNFNFRFLVSINLVLLPRTVGNPRHPRGHRS